MYINIRNIECFHYFENYAFLIDRNGSLIKLTSLQTCIISVFFRENSVSNIILQLSNELNLSKMTIQCYIDQVLATFQKYFYYSSSREYISEQVLISGKINQRFPLDLTISLTNFCGQRCKHCLSNSSNKSRAEISYSYLEKLLLSINEKVHQICLTGGEPLLYSQIETLICTFKENFKFTVVTSGYGLQNIPNTILKQMNAIQISIHGGNAEEHDNFVQNTGAFSQVNKFIERIQELGINFVAVTQAKNNDIEHLKRIIDYCIQRNIKKLIIGELSPLGRAKELPIWDSYDVKLVEKNITYLAKEYQPDIEIIIDDEIHKKIGNPKFFFSCGAGAYKWFINEKGQIYPCMLAQDDIYQIGSIYDHSYWDLINCADVYHAHEKRWMEESYKLFKYCENMGGLLVNSSNS